MTVVMKKEGEECGIDRSTGWEGKLLHVLYIKHFN